MDIERLVTLGVRVAGAALADTKTTVGGVVKPLTRTERIVRDAELEATAAALDVLHWYGPWGTTRHGIKMELIARAKALAQKSQ